MAERRINIDKDLVNFVKELSDSDSERKIFETMAHCLAYAAAYGFKNNCREKVTKAPIKKVDPIAFHIFERHRFENLFIMLAMASVKDPKSVLGSDGDKPDLRVSIFEEYAKGGLKLLKSDITGMVDYLDPLTEITLKEEAETRTTGFNIDELKM